MNRQPGQPLLPSPHPANTQGRRSNYRGTGESGNLQRLTKLPCQACGVKSWLRLRTTRAVCTNCGEVVRGEG